MRHDYDIHDDPDDHKSVEDYREELRVMTLEQLIEETEADEKIFTLNDFIEFWNKEI